MPNHEPHPPPRRPSLGKIPPLALAFWAWTLTVAATEGAVGWSLRSLPLERESLSSLAGWSLGLLALLALRVVGSWRRDLSQERAALDAGERLADSLWNRDHPPPLRAAWLATTGREIAEQGNRAAHVLLSSLLSLIILIPLMIWISPLLSLSLVATTPFLTWVARRRSRSSRQAIARDQEATALHAQSEQWAWRSREECEASGFLPLLAALRRGDLRSLGLTRRGITKTLVGGQAATEAAAHVAGWILSILALAAWNLHLLSSNDLLAFLAAALLAYRPIREAGRALPAWHRLRHLQDEIQQSSPAPLRPPTGLLEVRNARVHSREGIVLVEGPSFQASPGDAIVFTGPNGCGKTSLLAGIAGWRAMEGLRARPRKVFALAQEPVLPPFSPRRWSGKKNPDDLPLTPILFPRGLPLDWDAPIAEGGSLLSRGERARLALLCLTARPADLWLFDEPFSAMPQMDHAPILQALRALQGRTVLVFTDPSSEAAIQGTRLWTPADASKAPEIVRL